MFFTIEEISPNFALNSLKRVSHSADGRRFKYSSGHRFLPTSVPLSEWKDVGFDLRRLPIRVSGMVARIWRLLRVLLSENVSASKIDGTSSRLMPIPIKLDLVLKNSFIGFFRKVSIRSKGTGVISDPFQIIRFANSAYGLVLSPGCQINDFCREMETPTFFINI